MAMTLSHQTSECSSVFVRRDSNSHIFFLCLHISVQVHVEHSTRTITLFLSCLHMLVISCMHPIQKEEKKQQQQDQLACGAMHACVTDKDQQLAARMATQLTAPGIKAQRCPRLTVSPPPYPLALGTKHCNMPRITYTHGAWPCHGIFYLGLLALRQIHVMCRSGRWRRQQPPA